MASGQLFSRTTQALFYNYKQLPIQQMLDFDFLCGRETPSVAGIINPGSQGFQKLFFGQEEIVIPVHATIEAACAAHPTADVFINFASFRSAAASSMAALEQPTIRVVAIIAEGVPGSDTTQLIAYARANNKVVIGPATVGGIQAGAFKIGDTAGTIDNIIHCKLYRPGSVGYVSKSGGMSNELYNTIARVTDGIYEGIAIGDDVFPGSTLSDHVLRFNNIPQVKMMVVLEELGGHDEYSLVEALKQGKVTKPVVAWVSGTCARLFKPEVQFGHAGAKSGGELESSQAKNQALKEAGAVVPTSYEAFEAAIKETFDKLVEEGKIIPVKEFTPPTIPEDLNSAIKSGKVRVPTHIISTICDERGKESCYVGVPMSSIIEKGYGVGDVISLMWFKRNLPHYCTQFVEMCIMLCADHGPCASGAHNTIVTARAGKDLISSLVSDLLTIGPRFGGAIDDAARYFKDAHDRSLIPYEFVENMKKKGIRVPGIGHRIKNRDNKDKRVELLQQFACTHFPSVKYMEYAVQVEMYTLMKANNLILNIDGAIGSLFLDLLAGSGMFTKQEIDEIVEIGYLNGLFVLARSIGLIGHTFDQKRLKQPLYRHPWEDVLYTNQGAKSGGELESAQATNQTLQEAGVVVPTSYKAFEAAIKETFDKLVEEGKITPVKEFTLPTILEDLYSAIKSGKVCAPTHIISTICDERGKESCYAGVPMSSIIEKGYGVGDVISLLWFKRSLPRYCTQFIEMCIMLCADHGPCASGAHNTIVTARAEKDLVSSLVSGLLTIGPRFGGAIDDAARYFKDAHDRGLTPDEFVESMKKKGIRVLGIGHRVKNRDNNDKRVELLQRFARTHFPSVKYMEYAVQVETYTLMKANNLILNIDGAIGSLFLDLLGGSGMFTKQEIDEIVEIGYLNGLFVLARSIGLIGHSFDQKRLKQPLYRHPWEDVLYTK